MNDTAIDGTVTFEVNGRPFKGIVTGTGEDVFLTVKGTDAVGRGRTIAAAIEAARANLIELAEQMQRDREKRTTVDGTEAIVVAPPPAELQIPREKITLVEARRRLDLRKENAAKEHAALALQKERVKTADAEVAHALENLLAAVDREVSPELPLDEAAA